MAYFPKQAKGQNHTQGSNFSSPVGPEGVIHCHFFLFQLPGNRKVGKVLKVLLDYLGHKATFDRT